jgi:hypothetical protein
MSLPELALWTGLAVGAFVIVVFLLSRHDD